MEGTPEPRQEGRQVGRRAALLAAAPVVHTITQADLAASRPGPHLSVSMSQGVVARMVASLILCAVAFYYLSSGRTRREPGRFFWAVVFGFLALAVFLV